MTCAVGAGRPAGAEAMCGWACGAAPPITPGRTARRAGQDGLPFPAGHALVLGDRRMREVRLREAALGTIAVVLTLSPASGEPLGQPAPGDPRLGRGVRSSVARSLRACARRVAECVPGGWQPYRQPDQPADRVPGAPPPHGGQVPGGAAEVELEPAVGSDHHCDEQAGRGEGEERNADDERLGGQEADGDEEPADEVGGGESPGAEAGGGLCPAGAAEPPYSRGQADQPEGMSSCPVRQRAATGHVDRADRAVPGRHLNGQPADVRSGCAGLRGSSGPPGWQFLRLTSGHGSLAERPGSKVISRRAGGPVSQMSHPAPG